MNVQLPHVPADCWEALACGRVAGVVNEEGTRLGVSRRSVIFVPWSVFAIAGAVFGFVRLPLCSSLLSLLCVSWSSAGGSVELTGGESGVTGLPSGSFDVGGAEVLQEL